MRSTNCILVFTAVSCLSFLIACETKINVEETCPKVSVMPNFDATAYMGLWYESAKYPALFETGGTCVTANYKLLSDGTVEVINSQHNKLTQAPISITGNAVVVDNAKLLVNFPSVPGGAKTGSNYWVLSTDYENYSVVFSCSDKSTSKSEMLWILTRTRSPSVKTIIDAVKIITKNNLSVDKLLVTSQENCQ